MSDSWQDRAQRGISLLDPNNDAHSRTLCILKSVLDLNNRDDYISRDFFNVQQTAGGLPADVSFESFLQAITGHVREDLAMSNFAPEMSDDDFLTALLSIDDNIRRHIRFLNGVVHQAAPGEVHVKLWNLILDSLKDDRSVYACYRDFLVDDR